MIGGNAWESNLGEAPIPTSTCPRLARLGSDAFRVVGGDSERSGSRVASSLCCPDHGFSKDAMTSITQAQAIAAPLGEPSRYVSGVNCPVAEAVKYNVPFAVDLNKDAFDVSTVTETVNGPVPVLVTRNAFCAGKSEIATRVAAAGIENVTVAGIAVPSGPAANSAMRFPPLAVSSTPWTPTGRPVGTEAIEAAPLVMDGSRTVNHCIDPLGTVGGSIVTR
jgi:hypothetical protein